ncbi:MAG: metalloendopeptidase-like rane protein [Bacteroidota bacterium]|jgi:murein DD-endopeptidase MepM/ murein hydrolase activator NlpD|nr:metalloendopeptidase-like rane protein [Bacteroidota bacterium]
MKKIILSFFLFISILTLRAVNPADISILNMIPGDTIPLSLDEDELMDFNDSLVSFPAYDLYCGWDTVNIHAAKFDVSCLKDSTKNILLYSENSCGYVHPFEGKITSSFGPRKRRYHYGVDIDLETGDCVAAAFDGRVRIVKKSKSYGNVIVIRHSSGLETYYAHLSQLNVEIGQEVFAGQVIGLGGNTGRSRGSHLHFEVRYMGQPINPSQLISFDQHKLISDTLTISSNTFSYLAEAKKAAAKNAHSKGKGRVHVVKKGDTLSAIARKYGTTTKALCQKNGLKSTSKLRLGQKIRT